MQESPLYIDVLGISVPVYGIALAVSALIAIPLLLLCLRRFGMQKRIIPFSLTMLASGMVGSRLLFCLYGLIAESGYMEEKGISVLWAVRDGGLMMYGMLFAVLIGVLLYSRAMDISARKALDAAAPALCFFTALARFSEYFYPFAWENSYSEWIHPIFMLEGILLILLTIYLLVRLGRGKRTYWQFLLIYSALAIITESLSRYGVPAFGFVKANMLISAFTLGGYSIYAIVKGVRGSWVSFMLLVVMLGAIIGIEFALDKSTVSNALLYCLMALLIFFLSIGAVRLSDAVEGMKKVSAAPAKA